MTGLEAETNSAEEGGCITLEESREQAPVSMQQQAGSLFKQRLGAGVGGDMAWLPGPF